MRPVEVRASGLTQERNEHCSHEDCRPRHPIATRGGARYVTPIIGVDLHKRSHTAVVLDAAEQIDSQVQVLADRRQLDRLMSWAQPWPQRIWAIENVHGLGKLLSQQLLRRGEQVVDVPTTLSYRTRQLSGQSGRKTDAHDAR